MSDGATAPVSALRWQNGATSSSGLGEASFSENMGVPALPAGGGDNTAALRADLATVEWELLALEANARHLRKDLSGGLHHISELLDTLETSWSVSFPDPESRGSQEVASSAPPENSLVALSLAPPEEVSTAAIPCRLDVHRVTNSLHDGGQLVRHAQDNDGMPCSDRRRSKASVGGASGSSAAQEVLACTLGSLRGGGGLHDVEIEAAAQAPLEPEEGDAALPPLQQPVYEEVSRRVCSPMQARREPIDVMREGSQIPCPRKRGYPSPRALQFSPSRSPQSPGGGLAGYLPGAAAAGLRQQDGMHDRACRGSKRSSKASLDSQAMLASSAANVASQQEEAAAVAVDARRQEPQESKARQTPERRRQQQQQGSRRSGTGAQWSRPSFGDEASDFYAPDLDESWELLQSSDKLCASGDPAPPQPSPASQQPEAENVRNSAEEVLEAEPAVSQVELVQKLFELQLAVGQVGQEARSSCGASSMDFESTLEATAAEPLCVHEPCDALVMPDQEVEAQMALPVVVEKVPMEEDVAGVLPPSEGERDVEAAVTLREHSDLAGSAPWSDASRSIVEIAAAGVEIGVNTEVQSPADVFGLGLEVKGETVSHLPLRLASSCPDMAGTSQAAITLREHSELAGSAPWSDVSRSVVEKAAAGVEIGVNTEVQSPADVFGLGLEVKGETVSHLPLRLASSCPDMAGTSQVETSLGRIEETWSTVSTSSPSLLLAAELSAARSSERRRPAGFTEHGADFLLGGFAAFPSRAASDGRQGSSSASAWSTPVQPVQPMRDIDQSWKVRAEQLHAPPPQRSSSGAGVGAYQRLPLGSDDMEIHKFLACIGGHGRDEPRYQDEKIVRRTDDTQERHCIAARSSAPPAASPSTALLELEARRSRIEQQQQQEQARLDKPPVQTCESSLQEAMPRRRVLQGLCVDEARSRYRGEESCPASRPAGSEQAPLSVRPISTSASTRTPSPRRLGFLLRESDTGRRGSEADLRVAKLLQETSAVLGRVKSELALSRASSAVATPAEPVFPKWIDDSPTIELMLLQDASTPHGRPAPSGPSF
eukprot:TRINITY_DN10330_c0_g1_i2.p1 TRINITY_DN10330_c0_g1~~TRINITY_DN10330_c0_g1_i2.p1  ORF type:complete len:1057 (-),score=230.88 TRINITY_DN10330_c0_g1_i2:48-3218(-)